jgi:putative nucleotidyltransferase with HDIG domain
MIPQTNQNFPVSAVLRPRVDIESLVETKLPPAPGSMIRITNLLRDYNASTRQITEAISYEPALVARILRLANSPIYSLETNVTSVAMAINAVGTKTLQDIVMVEFAAATFGTQIRNSPIGQKIWEHSLAVAMLARELSKMLEMHGTEETFTCGLLHDLGKLILLNNDFEAYAQILTENEENEMLIAETRQFGYNHTEVGSLVARRWGLPEGVCCAILHHHNPSQAEHPMLVAHIVDAADIVANVKGYGVRSEDASKLVVSESIMKLNFTPEILESTWDRLESNIQEIIKAFS